MSTLQNDSLYPLHINYTNSTSLQLKDMNTCFMPCDWLLLHHL